MKNIYEMKIPSYLFSKKSKCFVLVSTFLSVVTQLKLCSKYFDDNKTKNGKSEIKHVDNISLEPERKTKKKNQRVSV